VAIETQGCGVPVSGGLPEVVIDGQTGLVVDAKDEHRLADTFIAILTDQALRKRMSKAARLQAEGIFDIATQTAKLERIYDGCIRHHQPAYRGPAG